MSKISKIIYLFIGILFFILLNFFCTDIIIDNGFNFPENPLLDIIFVQNQGAAFNLFEGYKIFLILFAIFAFIGIIIYTIKQIEKVSVFALFFISMLNAGIFNNMMERIIFGYVRDFIKLNFVDFPVFNISDILINIGVLGIVFLILKNNFKPSCR